MKKTSSSLFSRTIAVVGLGYVGLPLALLADRKGYQVIGIDIDDEKVKRINRRVSPFIDLAIEKALPKSGIEATTDFRRVREASVIVICVPTPVYDNHAPNLEPVMNACEAIAPHLTKDHLVVLESTVNPGVCDSVILPILEKRSGLIGGADFFLAHCPERVNPGDLIWTVENIPRVLGSLGRRGLKRGLEFYRSIIKAPIRAMQSLKEAEAVKIVENSFRDVNIAFVNELAMSFSRLGIDLTSVIEGAATKPFSFLKHLPGCGVGGHCIPVDPYDLIEYAEKNGFHHSFLSLARQINEEMPKFTAEQLLRALNDREMPLKGTRVSILGIAYKPDIDDYRESPALKVIERIAEYGGIPIPYDPFVPERSAASSLEDALEGSGAAVITTAHTAFRELKPEAFLDRGVQVVVDGRNCLPKNDFVASGITYRGIGR